MSTATMLTIVGNLTADPELRFTPNGMAVANFTVASTPRILNRQTDEWEDGEALFLRCTVWRDVAENVAETILMWISKATMAFYQLFSDVDMSRMRAVAMAVSAH